MCQHLIVDLAGGHPVSFNDELDSSRLGISFDVSVCQVIVTISGRLWLKNVFGEMKESTAVAGNCRHSHSLCGKTSRIGASLEIRGFVNMPETFACSDCNHILNEIDDAAGCSHCGAKWDDERPEPTFLRKLIAILISTASVLVFFGLMIALIENLLPRNFGLGKVCGGVMLIASLALTYPIYCFVLDWRRTSD